MPADARSTRDRTPTGYVHEEDLEPEQNHSLRFSGAVDVQAASSSAAGSDARDLKTRVPTGFVYADDLPQEPQPPPGVRFTAAAPSSEPPPSGATAAEGLRSVKDRVPTGYVHSEDLPDGGAVAGSAREVHFGAGHDVVDAASRGPLGASRPVKGRVPTGFVEAANVPEAPGDRRQLKFAAGEQVLQAASSVSANGGRQVKDRVPTGFVHAEELTGQAERTAASASSAAPAARPVASASSPVQHKGPWPALGQRSAKTRTPTGFVRAEDVPKAGGVTFAAAPDGDQQRPSAEDGGSPSGAARSIKQRVPTGFVRTEDIPSARAGLFDQALKVESAERKSPSSATSPEAGSQGGARFAHESTTSPQVSGHTGVRFADVALSPASEAPVTPQRPRQREPNRGSEGTPGCEMEDDCTMVCSVGSTSSNGPAGHRKVTFRKQESVMNIEARELKRRPTLSGSASAERSHSYDSNDSAELSTVTPQSVGRRATLSLEEEQMNTPGEDMPSYLDDDAASSCSSRNPRSRMSTPFISSVNLGFDCISHLINDSNEEETPGSTDASEFHERSRRRLSSKGTSRFDTAGSVEEADRAAVKQASLESSIEREIAERVLNYAQSQRPAREERSALATSAADHRLVEVKTKGRAELDLETHLVRGAAKEKDLAMTALKKLPFFEDFNADALDALIEAMEVYEFEDGVEVVHQGDTDGTHFFVVAAGEFLVLKDGKPRCTISPSNCFGESVLLLFGERNATVCASGRATAYGMEGMTVRDMLQEHYEQRRKFVMQAVDDVLDSEQCDCLCYLTNAYQLQTLYDKAETRSFAEGQTLLAEGPPSLDGVMVFLKGRVSASAKGEEIGELDRFALLGDRALLFGEQAVTLIAKEHSEVLFLRRGLLDTLFGDELPKVFLRSRILHLLAHHRIFSRLHEDQREAVTDCCEVAILRKDEELDSDDLRFVAVLHGEVDTRLADDGPSPEIRKYSGTGASPTIGEENLLRRDQPWDLRVRATSGSAQLATWRSKDLDSILTFDNLDDAIEQEDKVRILRSLILFKTLPRQQLKRLADGLRILHFRTGVNVCQQGEIGTHFYIIRKGNVLIEIDGRRIRTIGMGDYFGERALLFSEPRSATVSATEDTELWAMEKETFQEIIHGPCVEYLTARIALQDTKVTFADLDSLRVIGRGGFGVVRLVTARRTGVRYALKCVRKRHIVEHGAQKALVTELAILRELDHPFIVKFVKPFRTDSKVFFLMELVTGGELLDALDTLGILGLQHSQFYTGSILLALEFLHARQIAYLDLKSENCLIDHQGYLKIIDFGIAQRITRNKCHVMLGTPIIMAPEMILGKGYTTVADLWSLGICLYDFVIGHFPFGSNAATKIQLYQEIIQGELAFPGVFMEKAFARDASSLIRGLLTRDPAKRLGGGFEGYSAIKQHPFFEGFNWDALLGREIAPPFIPKGETYGEDREDEGAGHKDALPAEPRSLADEVAADTEDADWIDPSPGWDEDFAF